MKQGEKNNKNGFTIIEVSVVLAIAGLIFLMTFIALPQLQRSQRDSKRRDDILLFLEKVKKYQSNNRGALPGTPNTVYTITKVVQPVPGEWNSVKKAWQGFYNDYLGDSFKDPHGGEYKLAVRKCSGANTNDACTGDNLGDTMDYTLHIYTEATCSGEQAIKTSNPRNLAVLYRLEGSGIYCANT